MSEPFKSPLGRPTASDWRYLARRTWHSFIRHRGPDAAGALTFYGALAVFPVALAVVSTIAAFDRRRAVANLVSIVNDIADESTADAVEAPFQALLSVPNPWLGVAVGVVVAVWTLSTYAAAFGRALDNTYEAEEGRTFIRFRALMVVVGVVLTVAFVVMAALLLVTPRVAWAIAEVAGFGDPWVTAWNFGKWPVLAVLALLVFAMLYYVTPTVRHHRVRWIGVGSGFALVLGGLATAAFSIYVTTVSNYDRLYGWLGGAIITLVWLYIVNFAAMLGAEVDAEFTRFKQLRRGVPAEELVRMPMRDTRRALALAREREQDVRDARAIRERAEQALAQQAHDGRDGAAQGDPSVRA